MQSQSFHIYSHTYTRACGPYIGLEGEPNLLKKLEGKGYNLKMYKRYIHDILVIVEGGEGKGQEAKKE